MKIYYDNRIDALYIELRPLEAGIAISRDLNDEITETSDLMVKLPG